MPIVPTDPFEQLAVDYGLRVSVERLSVAPRDLAAPPDEAECAYLVTVAGPEGGTAARLVFMTALQDRREPGLRDALWWLASDAWAVERAAGDATRWAAVQRLTLEKAGVDAEFGHYAAQTRSLALAVGDEAYRRLLNAYEGSVARASSRRGSTPDARGRQQQNR